MLIPPAPFQLRPLHLTDLDEMLAIDQLSFPTPAKATLYQHELTQNNLAYYQGLMVAGNGRSPQLIGYCGYWLLIDEAHISTIAIHPNWRSRHLGELLLLNALCLAYGQQAQLATLEVRRSNTVAQNLYHKYLFEIVGERSRYYHDTGEDALIMTALLSASGTGQQLENWQKALFSLLASAS